MNADELSDPWWLGRPVQTCSLCLMAALLAVLVAQGVRMALHDGGNDFSIYLRAARALAGGVDPYRTIKPYPYLYPLFLAFIVLPLTLVPYWLASVFWHVLCMACLVVGCASLARDSSRECGAGFDRRLVVPGLAALLAFFPPILSSMIHGQINPIVLFCCAMFYGSYVRQRTFWAAGWLAAAIAIKLIPAVLLVFLLVRGQWRIALWTLLFAAIFCLLPGVVAGKSLVTYYRSYLEEFVLPSMAGATANTATHFSLQGAMGHILSALPVGLRKIICLLLAAAAVFAVEAAAARSPGPRRDIWSFCAYLAACLLISPVVELHHFVLAAPAVFLLGVKAFFDRSWTTTAVLFWIGAFIACFSIAGRFDTTTISYFGGLAILLVLLFSANRQRAATL